MAVPDRSEWIRAQVGAQRSGDRDVRRLLNDVYRQVSRQLSELERRPGIGAAVRADQLRIVRRELTKQIADLSDGLYSVVSEHRLEAAERATNLGAQIDATLFEAAGSPARASALREGLVRGLERTLDVAMARMSGRSHVPLSRRVYRSRVWVSGRVESSVNSALARGLSAREFATEVRGLFNPNTPGGTRYAAMRLARTEINNAFHAIAVDQAADKPWAPQMRWNLSGSHPRPDECDELAEVGLYSPEDIPEKPHPHCFCFVTPEVMATGEFIDRLNGGDFDDYLRRYGA